MSRLEALRKLLYGKKYKERPRPPGGNFAPPSDMGAPSTWPTEPGAPEPFLSRGDLPFKVKKRRPSVATLVLFGLLFIIAIAALGSYFLFFTARDIDFTIRGPAQVVVGESTVFAVTIRNRSNVPLREGAVTLSFPPGVLVVFAFVDSYGFK